MMKKLLSFLFTISIVISLSAQNAGDYRTVKSGTWPDETIWERFGNPNPGVWNPVPDGQEPSTNSTVTIRHYVESAGIFTGGTVNWTVMYPW